MQKLNKNNFDTIESALEDIALGKIIIVVDDEDRENEGDMFCAADKITAEKVNFMLSQARGLLGVSLYKERCEELDIKPVITKTNSLMGCAFGISVDLIGKGCTTGVSTHDRAETILALSSFDSQPSDFARPGHMFPFLARSGGILERRGHTEASVELAKLAGLYPAGVIIEILNEDGTMARRADLFKLAKKYKMKIISIEDLVQYKKRSS